MSNVQLCLFPPNRFETVPRVHVFIKGAMLPMPAFSYDTLNVMLKTMYDDFSMRSLYNMTAAMLEGLTDEARQYVFK